MNKDILKTNFLKQFTIPQVEFLLSEDKLYNILNGSVRSGKTYVSLFKFGLKIMNSDKSDKFMMAATNITSLERNCLKLMLDFFGEKLFSYNMTKKKAYLMGREIYLEGCPNSSSFKKIQGLTLKGAYVDEATNIDKGFVDMLITRLSVVGRFVYFTCNPDSPNHWFYKEFITNEEIMQDMAYYCFLLTDNTFLDIEYIEAIKRKYTGVFFQRYILGLWVASEGVVFEKFANNKKAYMLKCIQPKDIAYISCGCDFGGNKSKTTFVATAVLRNRADGVVVLKSERMNGGKGEISPEEVYKESYEFIKEVIKQYGIHPKAMYCDNAEQYIVNGMRNYMSKMCLNVPIIDAKKIHIIDRIKFVSSLTAVTKIRFIEDETSTAVDCLCELVWDNKKENTLLDNGTTDNDTWDALSYSIERSIGELQPWI